jgi:hypothetical protein
MTFALIFWLIFSVVVASAAKARGRDPVGWLLLSIVTTPIIAGFFLLLFPVSHPDLAAVDDRGLEAAIRRSGHSNKNGLTKQVILLAVIGVVLAGLSLKIYDRFAESDGTQPSTSVDNKPASAASYGVIATYPCSRLLSAYANSKFDELSEPLASYISAYDSGFGSTINIISYALTECRLNESEDIGKAVSNLFEQKRLNRLPRIPIGGATNDARVEADWVAFRKWIGHQGPRPDFKGR